MLLVRTASPSEIYDRNTVTETIRKNSTPTRRLGAAGSDIVWISKTKGMQNSQQSRNIYPKFESALVIWTCATDWAYLMLSYAWESTERAYSSAIMRSLRSLVKRQQTNRRRIENKMTPTKSHKVPNAGIPASLQPCMISELPV